MAPDVFISYCAEDKTIADAACAILERERIRCWIAPRDVQPGVEYAESIMRGITNSRIFVLVFSSKTNRSPHVRREVERAVSKGKIIVPFRIEDVLPTESLEFCLSSTHWLDAMTPPLERHLARLAEVVADLLSGKPDEMSQGLLSVRTRAYRPWPRSWRGPLTMVVLVVLAGALAYFVAIPSQVDRSLAYQWRMGSPQSSYERASSWQRSPLLRDKSIATYWRIMSFQRMHEGKWAVEKDARSISDLEQEYHEALHRWPSGRKTDGILYRYAHFKRKTGDHNATLQTLTRIQRDYPSSYWREGIAYYLAELAIGRGDDVEAAHQINIIESFSLNARLYDFDAAKNISVREGIAALRQQMTTRKPGP
jgi:hypothetical protein